MHRVLCNTRLGHVTHKYIFLDIYLHVHIFTRSNKALWTIVFLAVCTTEHPPFEYELCILDVTYKNAYIFRLTCAYIRCPLFHMHNRTPAICVSILSVTYTNAYIFRLTWVYIRCPLFHMHDRTPAICVYNMHCVWRIQMFTFSDSHDYIFFVRMHDRTPAICVYSMHCVCHMPMCTFCDSCEYTYSLSLMPNAPEHPPFVFADEYRSWLAQ